ncbi:host attachment family protein [Mangrovicoccus algicola]|uniref:Host attachment protein n=1 Tax=Mangrovicoccus algicola TaxID=2771008 RepID=A0A8J7CGY7_9RHOB|nr:host attachment family protein [Mangrovicoccus algicola]MBE3637665.1 host attachment protein [Mangrovicoccus algicola]
MAERNSGLKQGAWVLIADGEKALFLRNVGDEIDMNLAVISKEEQENPPSGDWKTDRAGRFNDGPSVQRSSVEETDWHQLEKERFATDLADMLYKSAHAGRFDTLVILASRPVLSTLRKELHGEVQARLVLDIPKVVTNVPLDEVERIVAREMAEAA